MVDNINEKIFGMGMVESKDLQANVELNLQGIGTKLIEQEVVVETIARKRNHRQRYREARREEYIRQKFGRAPRWALV